jgi:hypothetical protein
MMDVRWHALTRGRRRQPERKHATGLLGLQLEQDLVAKRLDGFTLTGANDGRDRAWRVTGGGRYV